jgi:hypothetical protein
MHPSVLVRYKALQQRHNSLATRPYLLHTFYLSSALSSLFVFFYLLVSAVHVIDPPTPDLSAPVFADPVSDWKQVYVNKERKK